MGKIYLIGTHHYDLNGPEKLQELYSKLKPTALFSEAHPENNKFIIEARENFAKQLKKRGYQKYIKEICELMVPNWEYETNESYSQGEGVPNILADKKLPLLQKIISKKTNDPSKLIEIITKQNLSEAQILEFFLTINETLYNLRPSREEHENASTHILQQILFTGKRDAYMEKVIRNNFNDNGTYAFPLGQKHCYKGMFGQLLGYRIRDLNPEIIIL